jgi:hypothetical protein
MPKVTLPLLLIALAALAATAPAAPIPDDAKGPVLYFPTARGAAWEYESGDTVLTWVVTDVATAGGKTRVSVRRGETGRGVYDVSAGGVTMVSDNGAPYRPGWHLLQLPADPAAGWVYDTGRADGKRPEDRQVGKAWVGGRGRVRVPAGTYPAVRVESEAVFRGQVIRATSWYSPGVGLVRHDSNGHTVMALRSFTPGKN